MAHPDGRILGKSLKKCILNIHNKFSSAIFAMSRFINGATKLIGNEL
jgi:hypothetical protein